ncbi:alpha/beta fold hydrolase [Rhodocaloribacter litoris]|uniref:esterase/lipase family protein n=1 Tax=Rhodocaloribacter litoris TaxID=2558931 RepID=UPI00141FD43D|nr:alpha/beta fold hydrolase [Rhodocaloribacter litoris]QXD16401.1 alpha/beta fold hydrolase [Rhodocaloribacter litoris]
MNRRSEKASKHRAALAPFPEPPLIRLRYPVMLMHGFGMLAAVCRGGMLHPMAMRLRAHGIRAYAPNVAPYETVPVRAAMWQARLRHVLDETGADRVHLIAHSMGGLDARYLITVLGAHDRVASLTTIATPHHGTALADLVLEQPERVRTWMAGLTGRMSAAAMKEASTDFVRAVAELTPAYVEETFNPAVPDHPAVRYRSYAGRAGRGTGVPMSPLLRPLNHLLFARDGVNDGFVAVERARWGTCLGILDADHLQQVGLKLALRSRFDAATFYLDLVRQLAAEEP